MPRGRRPATINCTHCGRDGHSSNICPRDDYSPDLPSLTCSQCVRTVGTARGGDNTNQIYVGIQPCSLHSTLTSQPPSAAPTALSTALAPTAPAPPAAAPAAAPVPHAAAPVPPATAPIPLLPPLWLLLLLLSPSGRTVPTGCSASPTSTPSTG